VAQPNFLCIVPDQWRYDWLGCAGHPVLQTPNLDALAADGVRFDRCYTNHPMCMATRATWFTGMTPRGHGVRCNGIPLDARIPTMPEALRCAGYRTHGIGKIHLNPWFPHHDYSPGELLPDEWPEAMPLWMEGHIRELPTPYYGLESVDFKGGNGQHGYGHYFDWLLDREPNARELMAPPPGVEMNFERSVEVAWPSRLPEELHATTWAAECAERFLGDVGADPFFLWLSIPDPHPPYSASAPWSDMYSPDDVPEPVRRAGELDDLPPHYRVLYEDGIPTAGRIAPTKVDDISHREVAAMAYGMAGAFDAMVGRVMKALEARGLAEDTVVCFMSDHGQMMGDHWMYSMPPCHLDGSIRVPSIWRFPAQFQRGVVSNGLVSHLDFAPTILDLAGVPIPEGATPPSPEAPRARAPWPGQSMTPLLTGEAERIQDSVITEFDADYVGLRLRTLITDDAQLTIYSGETYGELFDLREDPNQLCNLWDDPRRAGMRLALESRLLHRLVDTDNTLSRRMGHA
jgi:arylsulfatase A-like enzyme